jgi:single-strand DNA-binding protein
MNKVFLIGNLTRDPELTEAASGVAVCHFSIAVNRNYQSGDGERQTDFFNCVAWRGLAETCARNLSKGKKVSIVGSIQTRTYIDNQDIKRSVVEVIVQDVEFLSPKDDKNHVVSDELD